DKRIVDWTNAQNEWKRREIVLKYIASKGDEHELYALILDNRFVHHHRSVTQVRMDLNIAERTFNRMQEKALWEAARIIPANVLVEK
ncbi:transcriptional regulator, partial [Limosilactobacillus reuteri]